MRVFLALLLCFFPCLAQAIDYTNGTNGAINGTTTCAAPLIRTFTVPQAFTIADVNLGFQADHTWRGDIQLTLISPSSTSVQLINADTGVGGNIENYNVLLDDGAFDLINTGAHTTPDGSVAPPFENIVRPNNPLSEFNGEAAQGTWTLEICDAFPTADNGTFNIATLSLTEDPSPPGAGTPLSCAITDQIPFVWGGSNNWGSGSLVNGYSAGTIPLSFAITGDINRLIARNGIDTPVTDDEFTGGGVTQDSLVVNADFISNTESITVTMNVGLPGQGVNSIGFEIFDVDANTWVDQITVNGSFNGTAATPILTGSAFNTISGNSIIGTGPAPSTSGAANAEIVFTSAVDQIIMTYQNGPAAPANPASQVMSFFANMRLCPPIAADLTAIKSVEIADPAQGLYMVPGNELLYKITVTNSAAATAAADAINITDTLPDTLTFLSASTTGFTGGNLSNPAANTDCAGGACVVGFSGGSLPEDSVGEVIVRVRIQ